MVAGADKLVRKLPTQPKYVPAADVNNTDVTSSGGKPSKKGETVVRRGEQTLQLNHKKLDCNRRRRRWQQH